MKKLLLKYIPLIILIVIGLHLRLQNLGALTTFEWDQARDVTAMTEILHGKFTLIGPVVRGEGSFFLGPLYYYLGAVLLFMSGGNPLVLSLFAVLLDVLVGVLIYLYLSKKSPIQAILATSIWMSSIYLVKLSHVPWNVSLLELWMIAMIYLYDNFERSRLSRYAFFLLAAFSTHIHLSIVGMAFVFLLGKCKQTLDLAKGELLLALFLLFLPLSPLVFFDLRHSFLESTLFINFLKGGTAHAPLTEFIPVLIAKLDYTLSEFLVSSRISLLGISAFILALLPVFRKKKSSAPKLFAMLLIAVPIMLLFYRDVDFAEYYLIPMFIPLLFLLVSYVPKNVPWLNYLIFGLSILVIASGYNNLDLNPSPFSLQVKEDIAEYISREDDTIELRLEAPPGRRDGINYLLQQKGIEMTSTAPTIVVITESEKIATLLDRTDKVGEEVIGGLRVTIFRVQ